MENDMKPRIARARRLVTEIARVGALEAPKSARIQDETASLDLHQPQPQARALPVSPPNSLEGQISKVVVKNPRAREDLASRLHDTKLNLLDLCDRQLDDLLVVTPSGTNRDAEDADKLLIELTAVYRCMEAIASIEQVLSGSSES